MMAGRDRRTAFRNAILVVGPACVLTHAAAGLSLLGLLASSSDLIRGFGEAGFLATAIALVTVLSLVPAFGVLLIRNEARFVARLKIADAGVAGLRRFCAWIAVRMVSHPAAFSLAGFVAVAVSASLTRACSRATGSPIRSPTRNRRSRRADGLTRRSPDQTRSMSWLRSLPERLFMRPKRSRRSPKSTRSFRASLASATCGRSKSLRQWLARQMALPDVSVLQQYVDKLPLFLVRRFVNKDENAIIVFGLVADKDLTNSCRSSTNSTSGWTRRARHTPVRDRGNRPSRNRGAQQRGHDQQA